MNLGREKLDWSKDIWNGIDTIILADSLHFGLRSMA
jgi:hypothetical protein